MFFFFCRYFCRYNLLNFIEFRENIYYIFGLLCLLSWFIFNLWILRDYFFPWWFKPIYTDKGFNKIALERKKMEYLRRQHVNNIFTVPISIVLPDAVQSSMQNAPSSNQPLKNEILKFHKRTLEMRKNSQILNPITLSLTHSKH
ncbi:unnamed protein product [Brugia pahangi]|uniref:Transmembrane protein n=1 Tax=Brugia pahangi TaxID=6280 RepID=A0A3P7R0N6_BRUPA|nr:unnamed protein product [Brugia pahangi]